MRAGFKIVVALAAGLMPAIAFGASGGKDLGAVSGGAHAEVNRIIDERCLSCHNKAVIEKASAQKRDMAKLTKEMEGKGAILTNQEREVLQHFWKAKPFKDR